jgi:DNA-binding XRE family transcriptional regulator
MYVLECELLKFYVNLCWHFNCLETIFERAGLRIVGWPGVSPRFQNSPTTRDTGATSKLCRGMLVFVLVDAELRRRGLEQNPIDLIVGERLAALRTTRGVSLDQLGSVLGITGNEVADFESGAARVPPSLLIEICKYFQVTLQSLFPSLDGDRDPNLH